MTHSSDVLAETQHNGRSPAAQRGLKPSGTTAAAATVALRAEAATGADGPLGRSGLVDRCEYIRLLEQALSSLGFAEVAEQLEAASGIASQPQQVRCPAGD